MLPSVGGVRLKVKEMKKLYEEAGYRFKRFGKGDHEVWENERGEVQIFDGRDSMDIDKGLAGKMLKRIKPVQD